MPSDHEAGSELDKRVAVEVMKWRLADRRANGWGEGPPVWITHPEGTDPGDYSSPTHQGFNPSTDIADAMKVVEKMRADGWYFNVQSDMGMNKNWSAEFARNGEGIGFEKMSLSLPHAICLAALAAVAGRKETQ